MLVNGLWTLKGFCSPFLGVSNVTKITRIGFLNEQDMAYGSEGDENVRFKHKWKYFCFKA